MRILSKAGSGMVCGIHHDIVITEFIDKYFIIVSDSGKIGTLVEISCETDVMKASETFNSKTLFGIDKPEVHAVAQSIVETLGLKKPAIFGFSIKEYSAETASDMRQIISETLKNSERTTS